MADTWADADNIAGHFGTGRERQRRLYLVFFLDDEHIREIDARRTHTNFDFTGSGLG